MTAKQNETITIPIMKALDSAWSVIRRNHPEVPACALVMASGFSDNHPRWAHWATDRWTVGKAQQPELFIAGEGLARGGGDMMATLLHEATHAVAEAREIDDTSRQGRYHNGHFATLAAELGLVAAKMGSFGFAETTMTPATATRYIRPIALIDAAIKAGGFRRRELTGAAATTSNNGASIVCVCEPPRRIRVAPSVLELGEITCGLCGEDFS